MPPAPGAAAPDPLEPFTPDAAAAPAPDARLEPEGYVVGGEGEVRIHFLDWGGSSEAAGSRGFPGGDGPGVLLIPGMLGTALGWAPVARRLARVRRTVAMDLRGHGLSDAPPDGYDQDTLAGDAEGVVAASGVAGERGVVVAGLGFGACVAAALAARLGARCAGLVLVDGGFERQAAVTGLDLDELLRGLDEPPEVMRSMAAWLADRRDFDPATWDADQERAARDVVVETAAGRVVRAVRPHVVTAVATTMHAHDPAAWLGAVAAPVTALVALGSGEPGMRLAELRRAGDARVEAGRGSIRVAGFAGVAHNLPRYRPAEVSAAILAAGG
jgi:pimeloyl-ACP methyl ester carboxylesterase